MGLLGASFTAYMPLLNQQKHYEETSEPLAVHNTLHPKPKTLN